MRDSAIVDKAIQRRSWPEAEVVAEPVKKASEPRVLVRRRVPGLAGPKGENLMYLPGRPVISLFTGAGGMDLGLEQAGFCVLAQHEKDQAACQSLMANRPRCFARAALIQGDIYQTATWLLLREAHLRVGEADMVTGGPPCQGFSTINWRAWQRREDVRNDLVFEFLRVVDEAKPSFFIFENVPGFVSFNKHEYLKAFLERAHGAFYELVYGLVDAVEYGVPQCRCRFICMGTRRDLWECDGILACLPRPQYFAHQDLQMLQTLTAGPLWHPQSELLTHAPGIRYFPDRELLIPPRPVFNGKRSKGFQEFYRRLRVQEPDRIVTNPRGEE